MSENKFYQWPGCTNSESLLPRAVLIRRICNIAYIDLQIIDVPLPPPGDDFQKILANRLMALPYLEMNGEKFKTSREIWDHLVQTVAEPRIKQRLMKSDSILTYMIQQWCNECFINSLIYARWKKEDNFKRFISSVDLGPHATPEAINALRKGSLNYLKRIPNGDLDENGFRKLLKLQLASLANLIEDKTYFEDFAKHPTLTDLNVFMVIQGLMSPDLEESQIIEQDFPALVRWYKDVNTTTQKERLTEFHQSVNKT